jgi:hypothetical protein
MSLPDIDLNEENEGLRMKIPIINAPRNPAKNISRLEVSVKFPAKIIETNNKI